MFNQVCKRNIRCPVLRWCHSFEGSEWNRFRLPCSLPSWTLVWLPRFLHFSSVEPCTLFSLLHSDGGVNAVRLLLGFQQDYFKWYYFHLWHASPAVLTFEANSKQTTKSACWKKSRASPTAKPGSDRAINLSISSTAWWCAGHHLNGTLERGDTLLCAHRMWRELWSQAQFWQHGSMQGEWKLKSGISSDSCHLGRKSTLGQKEEPQEHPPHRVPRGWKDIVEVT